MSNLNTIALTGKNLEFWLEHSGLIKTLANNQGIYLKDVANTEFVVSKEMFAHSPNKEMDWALFVELASDSNTYSLSKGRQDLISNINYDSSNGYTPRQAAEMLDYLMFNTPRAPNANIRMIEIPEQAPAVPHRAPAVPEQAPAVPEQAPAVPEQAPAVPQEALITPIPQKSKGGKTKRQKQKQQKRASTKRNKH